MHLKLFATGDFFQWEAVLQIMYSFVFLWLAVNTKYVLYLQFIWEMQQNSWIIFLKLVTQVKYKKFEIVWKMFEIKYKMYNRILSSSFRYLYIYSTQLNSLLHIFGPNLIHFGNSVNLSFFFFTRLDRWKERYIPGPVVSNVIKKVSSDSV